MIQRALIVDDDLGMQRTVAREILKSYQVVLASAGEEAMAILARGDGIRAVVCDRDLGPGPDGLQVLGRAMELDPTCARILITGGITDEVAEEAIRSKVAHYVFIKPWERGELVRAVQRILSGASLEDDQPTQSEVRTMSHRIVRSEWERKLA
ncbi:MAG: response regulator [Deltaproteobacteria bacterium]|nr:response regulator [Deltaproteobacteria bacterium]